MEKITLRGIAFGRKTPAAVTVEPLPGHSDEEVVASLKDSGASRIRVLAPGFISALAKHSSLKRLSRIAAVHKKQESQAV